MDKVILVTNIFKTPRNSLGSFACKAKISLTGRRKKTKNVKIDWLIFAAYNIEKRGRSLQKQLGPHTCWDSLQAVQRGTELEDPWVGTRQEILNKLLLTLGLSQAWEILAPILPSRDLLAPRQAWESREEASLFQGWGSRDQMAT